MSPKARKRSSTRPAGPPSSASSTSSRLSDVSEVRRVPLPTVVLKRGLEGQDDNLDGLTSLYEELQVASVEAAQEQDFLLFAEKAFYFAVIHKEPNWMQPAVHVENPREISYAEWKTIDPLRSTPSPEPDPIDSEVEEESNAYGYTNQDHPSDTKPEAQDTDVKPDSFNLWGDDLNYDSWNKPYEIEVEPPTSDKLPSFDEYLNARYNLSSTIPSGPSKFSASRSTPPKRKLPSPPPKSSLHSLYSPLPRSSPAIDFERLRHQAGPYIGFVYLTKTQNNDAATATGLGELSIGIILRPADRGKGYARAAVKQVLQYVFDDRTDCHRVQALLTENYYKDRAMNLFTQMRFGHEGTRRRCFYSFGEWKDTTSLGILNTDWAMRDYFKTAPKSLWDEMFIRHDRERDELLQWEERQLGTAILQRSASMETIRDGKPGNRSGTEATTSAQSESENDDGMVGYMQDEEREPSSRDADADAVALYRQDKGKQRLVEDYLARSARYVGRSGADSGSDAEGYGSTRRVSQGSARRSASPTPSTSSYSSASTGRSAYPPSTAGSSSEWEMMDEDDYEIMSSLADDASDDSDEFMTEEED
ncbi:hypothetical protein V5O48_005903 [Marasmius crinis-equi]|uniref:N-acetyltransferase domain-containing protein n=1 Tax=Marasmius crinis-equi TaxID=585013 RepID=A0ABR3FLI1_9AGAR